MDLLNKIRQALQGMKDDVGQAANNFAGDTDRRKPGRQNMITNTVRNITPVASNLSKTFTKAAGNQSLLNFGPPVGVNIPRRNNFSPTLGEYTQGRVVKPFLEGMQSVQKPGMANKGIGALNLVDSAFSATPPGALFNAGFGGATGFARSLRTGQPLDESINQATADFTSLGSEGLGIENPYLAGGLDLLASRNPKAIISDPTAIKGVSKALQDIAPAVKGLAGYSPRSFKIHPDDQKIMQDFVVTVQSGKGKASLGQLGKDAQALAEHYIGNKAKGISNEKLASAFDALLASAAKARGEDVMQTPFPKMGFAAKQTGKGDAGVTLGSRRDTDNINLLQEQGLLPLKSTTRSLQEPQGLQGIQQGKTGNASLDEIISQGTSDINLVQPKLKVVNGKIKVNMEGVEAPKVSLKQQLTEVPERARMSQNALLEGVTSPRTGRDISVNPQATQRFNGGIDPLNQTNTGVGAETPRLQARITNTRPNPSDTTAGLPSARYQSSGNTASRSFNRSVPPKAQPVKITGVEKPGIMTKIREHVQDEWIRVKNLQRQKGVTVDETSNPYLKEELYHGRVGARLEDIKETVTALDKDIVKTAKALKEDDMQLTRKVNQYLHAKHAPERNARLGDGAAGMTNEQAKAVLKDIAQTPQGKEVVRIASKVKELNNKTLDILLEGEVIDRGLYNTLKSAYKDHVPLNRILDDTQDISDVLAGKGFNVRSTGIKRAKGSDKEVSDIVTNVVANVEQAIVRAERNRVNKATLNFARKNPQLGIFEEIKPKAIGTDFRGKPILKQINDPLVLHVREKGKPVYLKIKDEKLASVFQGIGQEKLPPLFNFVGAFTRFYSGLHTRFNPEFAASNIVRDTQELAVYMASQRNVGITGAGRTVTRDVTSSKSIIEALQGKNTPGARMYKQMQMDGGTTGGMALSTREKVELDLEKIRKLNRNNPRQAATKVLESFDKWNTVFEDTSRLSAYVQAIKNGYSREAAASIAKNSTVNFNKKGSGGSIINSLYMFSNASIQGSTKMLRAMRSPKVAATVLTAVGASTFAINKWNDSVDPDWREKVTEWDRNSNQVVVFPSSEGIEYLTIPVSWGIKPIKVASDVSYDLITGRTNDVGKAALSIAKAGIDAYNPAGGTDGISIVSPTILDLPVDLARNKSWSGAMIKPDWMEGLPQAEQRFSSTDQTLSGKIAVKLTDSLSRKTNRVLDFSPEQVLYAYDNLVGGVGRFATKSVNTAVAGTQGELPPVKDIPFASRFFKTRTEEQISQGIARKSESEFMKGLQDFETGSEAQKEEMREYLRTLESDEQRKKVLFKINNAGFPTKGVSYTSAKLGKSSKTTPKDRVFEQSPEAPQNLMERISLAAQGATKDPGNVVKAIFTEERLRKIEGNAVILEREQYLNNLDDENLHVDHVIPLGLGGDNSDGNLQVMTVSEKVKKDNLERSLIRQLQAGDISRQEAQEQIRVFNESNPSGVPYERMSKSKQSSLADKVVEIQEDDENGMPVPPKLTGKAELDKKLLSKYRGQVTKKKNEIVKAFEAGEITAKEAEELLNQLNDLNKKAGSKKKGGKGRKVKVKIPKFIPLGSTKALPDGVGKIKLAPRRVVPKIALENVKFNTQFTKGTAVPKAPKFRVKFNL